MRACSYIPKGYRRLGRSALVVNNKYLVEGDFMYHYHHHNSEIVIPHASWAPYWEPCTKTIRCPRCGLVGSVTREPDFYRHATWFFECQRPLCPVRGNLRGLESVWRGHTLNPN